VDQPEKTSRTPPGAGIALPLLAVVGAMAAFQVGAAYAKSLFPALGPQGAASLRLVFGALMLLVLFRPWRNWRKGANALPLIGLGACMCGAIVMFFLAIDRLPIGVAMALQFLGPLSIAIFGSRRLVDLVWAALAAGGVWLLVNPLEGASDLDPVGIAWAFGAAVSWAGYILIGRVATNIYGQGTASLAVTVAAIIILPIGVINAGATLLDVSFYPLALLVALLSVAIPFSLEFFAMPRLPARTFAVLMSLEPAFGVLFALLILSEVLDPAQLTGIALVIAASAGSILSGTRTKEAAPTDAPPN
jgi:inner membrane transporter RhtA